MGEPQESPRPGGEPPGRDPRLALFASGGQLDGAPPSARILGALESLAAPSGPGAARFAGSTHDEDAGMLAEVQAVEGHVAWLKLLLIRQVIRRHAPAVPGGGLPHPDSWDGSLQHEVAVILRMSWQAAVPVIDLAWQLGARLRGVDGLLERGVLSHLTAKIIVDEFSLLDDEKAAEAEKVLLDRDLGADAMTPGAIRRLCQQIAVTVDPESAERRRKSKERDARLDFYREPGGGMGLYGTGLPADQALLSDANIRARVQEYKDAGIKERTDFLRAQAALDLTNGVSAAERYAAWKAQQPGEGQPGSGSQDGDGPGSGPAPAGGTGPGLPAIVNLTAPLATILGQANRPGEAPGFGALDPALTQQLAGAAARSPRSAFCVTFTDADGRAAAHGCARLIRTRDGPPSASGWAFTRDGTRPGPKGGYGAWILRLPSGAAYRVDVHKIPLHDCDHGYATDAYRPTRLLRHLVEVRDGECTAPCCSRPARLCDFEHAIPWHKGGKTDGCNAGMRSRRCHRVKQLPGVQVTQPRPGWHRWRMPSGRSYTKGPKRYPA